MIIKYLYDIDGVGASGFQIMPDGLVRGTNGSRLIKTLNEESCRKINMHFANNECRWAPSGSNIKDFIVIPNNQTTLEFDYKKDCLYKFQIDFLTYIETDVLENIQDFYKDFSQLEVFVVFDKNGVNILEIPLDPRTIDLKFKDSDESGIYSVGGQTNVLELVIKQSIGQISNNKLKSEWINLSMTLDNPETIIGSKIAFKLVKPMKGVQLKIDNIKLIEECDNQVTKIKYINTNPSFQLTRVVDNKKSWVVDEKLRDTPRQLRETKYFVDDDKLVINSKELDLALSFNNAIEMNMYAKAKNNPNFIIDFMFGKPNLFFDFEMGSEDMDTLMEFTEYVVTQFNNPRSYRTLKNNAVIYLMVEKYLRDVGSINFDKLMPLIDKIDKYWLDIIAQFVPSTSIWESNINVSNISYLSDKFIYRKYGLNNAPNPNIITPTIISDVEIYVNGNIQLNKDIQMGAVNYFLGSEFYSNVTIDEVVNRTPLLMDKTPYKTAIEICTHTPKLNTHYYDVFSVGGVITYDIHGLIPFEGNEFHYYIRVNNTNYSVRIQSNGVIMSIMDLNGCPKPSQFELHPHPSKIIETVCGYKLGDDYQKLYTKIFAVGSYTYVDESMSEMNLMYEDTHLFHPVMYSGEQYAVIFNKDGMIQFIGRCKDIPKELPPPNRFMANGANMSANGIIDPNTDPRTTKYVVEFKDITQPSSANWGSFEANQAINIINWNKIPLNVGTYTFRCKSIGFQGNVQLESIWLVINNVKVTGALEVIGSETTKPCLNFPPTQSVDKTLYVSGSTLANIIKGSILYENPELTIKYTSVNKQLALTDLSASAVYDISMDNKSVVNTTKPCNSEPAPIVVGDNPNQDFETACLEYASSIKKTLYNNQAFVKGSIFYDDEKLQKASNIRNYENKYMVGVVNRGNPTAMLIEGGTITRIKPCPKKTTYKTRINPSSINNSGEVGCQISNGVGVNQFTKTLYSKTPLDIGVTLYENEALTQVFNLTKHISVTFIDPTDKYSTIRVERGVVTAIYSCGEYMSTKDIPTNMGVRFPDSGNACANGTLLTTKLLYANKLNVGEPLFTDYSLTTPYSNTNGYFICEVNRIKSVLHIDGGKIKEIISC